MTRARLRKAIAALALESTPGPAELGAAVYLKFADGESLSGLSDGDPVVTATDLIAGITTESPTVGARPLFRPKMLGGQDCIEFDGFTHYMRTVQNVTLGARTFWAVCQVAPQQTSLGLLYEHGTNAAAAPGSYLNAALSGTIVHFGAGKSGYSAPKAWYTGNVPQVVAQYSDGLHSGHGFRTAGENQVMTPLGGFTTDPGVGDVTTKLFIGGRNVSSLPVRGLIAEMAWFDRALTDVELAQLDVYAHSRYEIPT